MGRARLEAPPKIHPRRRLPGAELLDHIRVGKVGLGHFIEAVRQAGAAAEDLFYPFDIDGSWRMDFDVATLDTDVTPTAGKQNPILGGWARRAP